jgi:hypothetical protein
MELNRIDEDRLAVTVCYVAECGKSNVVTVTFRESSALQGVDVMDLHDAIRTATKGTRVTGYVVTLRNDDEQQSFALVLSLREP